MASTSTIELNRLRRPPPLQDSAYFTEENSPPVSPLNIVAQNAEEEDALAIQPSWKRSLYRLLEQPTSSPAAFVVHMFSTSLIILSAIITVLETVPTFHSISTRIWFGLETSIVALFTMEYAARCVAWSNTWSSLFYWVFCKSCNSQQGFSADISSAFYGLIDLLSVFPYYLELILQQDTVCLLHKLSCIFSLIPPSPYSSGFQYCESSGCFGFSDHFAIIIQFYCKCSEVLRSFV